MRSELNYAGKNLSEFGMWFDNSKVYKKPAKRFMGYDIPARNGTLYQSENKFNNVVIEFDCFIKDNFDQNYHDLVNFLNSFDTYQKLINSYNTDMFRMALFHEAIEVDTGQFLKDGRFKLFFDCKPQEYYADGAEFERIAPHSDIYTGNPAELENEGESSVISLRVALEPIQNLNGYDSPWVGGAGKNMLDIRSLSGQSATSSGVTFKFNTDGSITLSGTATANAYYNFLTWATMASTSFSQVAGKAVILSGGISKVRFTVSYRANASATPTEAHDTGSGATLTLPSDTSYQIYCALRVLSGQTVNETIYPMVRLATETDASFAPYENICPITGHTSASVTRTGKNFFNGQFAYHNADKYSPVLDGETYTVSSKSTGAHQINMQYITKTNTYYGDRKIVSEGDTFGKTTVTIPTDVKGILIYVNGDASNSQHTAYDTQIELGSTATDYEPYQGIPYTIDLNGTRYGGTVDIVTGVLTVTHGFVTFDGSSDENWTLQTDGRRCAIHLTNCKNVEGIRRTIGAISNLYEEKYPIDTWNSVIGFSIEANGDLVVRQFTTNTMTVANFRTFLQSNPMQICYPLQTPQTVQLTPQQISLLTGINYISSSGEVTITTRTPLTLKNPSPMTAKPVFKFTNISAPFTVSANGETIISFQNAIRLVKGGIVNNMFFNATGTNLIMQKQGTPNYEKTSFLINSGWLHAGRYYLATMPIGNLEVTSMDGTHLYSSGGLFTLSDITQVKVWYVITPDASTPQNFNFPIYLRPLGTLYVDSELMDCYMLDGDTAYSFNECVSLPKDFLQLDERTVITMTSGATGFIAPNWWRL